jgi:amino acid permease
VDSPNKRDRTRPAEMLGLSGVFAVFMGLVVWMSTRDLMLGLIFAGIAFIVTLIVIAMLMLAIRPDKNELIDMDEQDHDAAH